MRPFFYATCVIVVASLMFATPLAAKGGKGGGGGRGRASSGGGHGGGHGGGPKWNRQTSHPGGGGQRAASHEHKPTHGGGKQQFAHKPDKFKEDKVKEDKFKEDKYKEDKHDRSSFASDPTSPTTEPYNKKQKQLAIEQRNRDKRIAQAQHLREIGERNGNQNLIDNADRMEAFAHDHYARRVSQLEKFGVTDPLLNPDTGILDPLLPGTDGLVDPLGDVGLLDLLPLRP